jgi:hypothetical protein
LATLISQKKIEKEIIHGGFDVKLTSKAKHSCKLTRAYNPCKYRGPNPPKTVVVHQFLCRGLWHHKIEIIAQANAIILFFLDC